MAAVRCRRSGGVVWASQIRDSGAEIATVCVWQSRLRDLDVGAKKPRQGLPQVIPEVSNNHHSGL
jgi:hypothetical protein